MKNRVVAAMAIAPAIGQIFQNGRHGAFALGWQPQARCQPASVRELDPNGLLDAHSRTIDDEMLLAAAKAIASVVTTEQLNANYIIPSVFHEQVHHAVATAVRAAALDEPIPAEVGGRLG